MISRSDRGDRLILGLLGLALLVAAGAGVLYSYGVYGDDSGNEPFLADSVRDFVGRNGPWVWGAVAVVALLLLVLALRWLRGLVPVPPSAGPVELEGRTVPGATRVESAALADVLQHDLERARSVKKAYVSVVAWQPEPDLEVRLTVEDDTDLEELRIAIIDPALGRVCDALEMPVARARVSVALAERDRHVD